METGRLRNKRKLLISTSLMLIFSSSLSYALSCDVDIVQMDRQIRQYGSITSSDGQNRFTNVFYASESQNTCFAEGYYNKGERYSPVHICALKWSKGNWGNTLVCM